jgi:hypothetical protein
MNAAHTALSHWWRTTGFAPAAARPGEDAVREIERRYGVALPDDFRTYLLECAPQQDFWDEEDAIWWSPARLRNLPEEYPYPIRNARIAEKAACYIFFADYFIWSWAWAICCDSGADRGKVAVFSSEDRFVAHSFTEFVETYVTDPSVLY